MSLPRNGLNHGFFIGNDMNQLSITDQLNFPQFFAFPFPGSDKITNELFDFFP